jgi:O-antigen ligase
VIYWLNSLCWILPLNNVLSSVWAVIGIIIFISQVIRRKIEPPHFDLPSKKLWLIFSGWLLFTTLFAFDRSVALLGLLDFLPFIVFALIVSEVVKTEIQREQITQNLIVSTIPISLFGLFQVVFDQADLHLPRLFSSYIIPLGKSPDGRILSLFGHFNELGIFLVMILPLMIHGIVTKEERKRWISIVALPIGLICLFFSGSRNAWAVSTIGIIILTIFYGFWLGLGVILTGIITLVSAVWLPFAVSLRVLFPPRLIDRLLSTFDPQKTDFFSTVSRWNAWQIAIDLIGQSPIVGWGLRNFTVVARAQSQELFGLPHVHNLYLSIAVGAGLPGLILFLLAMFYTIRPKTDRTPLTFILQLSILLFLTSSILDITLYEPRISLLFWLIVGMLL